MYLILFLLGLLSSENNPVTPESSLLVSPLLEVSLDSIPPKKQRKKKKAPNSLSLTEEIKIMAKVPEVTPQPPNRVHPSEVQQCKMAFDKVDEFTGRQKKGLYPRTFFTFTPESYRKFLKEEEFILCEGYLTQSTGALMTLNIKLTIASKEAKKKFGSILPNSELIIRTMDNKEYTLQTYAGAKPTLVADKIVYECSYSIAAKDLKKLKEAEVDTTKIIFEQGSFTYDIYYLDFLKDQFPCFE